MTGRGSIRQPRGYSVNHASAQLPSFCCLERKYHGLYYQRLNLSQDTFPKLCKYSFKFFPLATNGRTKDVFEQDDILKSLETFLNRFNSLTLMRCKVM